MLCERCRERPGKEVYLVGCAKDWVECPNQCRFGECAECCDYDTPLDDYGLCGNCGDFTHYCEFCDDGRWAWNVVVCCGCVGSHERLRRTFVSFASQAILDRDRENPELRWLIPRCDAYLAAQDRRCGRCKNGIASWRKASKGIRICPDCGGSGYEPEKTNEV